MFITIEVADLDCLTHALLMAKCEYLVSCTGQDMDRWQHSCRNIDALDVLYKQLESARAALLVESLTG